MKRLLFLITLASTTGDPLVSTTSIGKAMTNFPERTAAQLYRQKCSSCHGPDGQANTPKSKRSHARNLADPAWQDDVTDERIFNSIMNGRNVRGNMPGFNKKISQQEAESLVTFVRGLRK